jgi:hypothetical protein
MIQEQFVFSVLTDTILLTTFAHQLIIFAMIIIIKQVSVLTV